MALTGKDILCISSIDWDFNWQGHQEIMATLAGQGNRVLFVENTGVRAPKLRDLPRLRRRLMNWLRSTKGFRQEAKNLFVYSPLILPFPYSRLSRRINRWLLLQALRRWMHATGFRRPIVWTFLPTKLVADLIDRLDPSLTVYYCIADFGQLSPRAADIARSERMLLDRTDLVFVQSETLRQRCAPHRNIHIFPFGVNMEAFKRQLDPAPELQSLKSPIVGYVGGLHRHVDFNLIERVAQEMEGTVVLVGPVQTDVDRLKTLRNVVLVGPQPHTRIPQLIRRFDVGIIPYLLTEYTRTVYPTKLNEYLAMGIPVVATDLPEIRRFNAEHGEVVAVASSPEAFVGATRSALGRTSPREIQRRIDIARQNSWKQRIVRMSALVEEALTAREEAEQSWEQTLRRLYRAAQRRVLRTALIVVAVSGLLFKSAFTWWVAEPLKIAEPAHHTDAIVVLAGGVGESGKAGGGYQERVKRAVDLYAAGMAPRMIFSSGYAFAFKEAEVMRELAVANGIPPEAIVLETKARNTHENIAYVKEILAREGWHSVLLVSSPYHMRRALLAFRKTAPEVQVTPVPVPESQFYAHERGASLEQIRGILHEYVAIVAYWWSGWI